MIWLITGILVAIWLLIEWKIRSRPKPMARILSRREWMDLASRAKR